MDNQEIPKIIYLQYFGDQEPSDDAVRDSDVTWARTRIFDHDIPYISVKTMWRILDASGVGDLIRDALELSLENSKK